jgi:hypothetical protein
MQTRLHAGIFLFLYGKTSMLINADFLRHAVVTPDQYEWIPSPQGGVERIMLDRIGGEKARATSIVRYAPSSYFPEHRHPGGEEIFVLSGTFSASDEHFPEGWYLRNPPGSSHTPFSENGAVIFVKLRQMSADDDQPVRIDTHDFAYWRRNRGGEVCGLFSSPVEEVALVRLQQGSSAFARHEGGTEILIIDGELSAKGKCYPKGSWIRLAAGEYWDLISTASVTTIYLKRVTRWGASHQAL